MFHNPIWKRAIAFIIIFSIVSSSFAGELSLPSDKRWIMIASRSTFEEAKQLADYYTQNFKGTAIFYTPNGKDNLPWYPITIGYVPYPAGTATLSKLIADGTIPNDSYLASGNKFTTPPNVSQTNTTNSTTNNASNSDGVAALLGLLAIGAVFYAIGTSGSSSNSDSSNLYDSSEERQPSRAKERNEGTTCRTAHTTCTIFSDDIGNSCSCTIEGNSYSTTEYGSVEKGSLDHILLDRLP